MLQLSVVPPPGVNPLMTTDGVVVKLPIDGSGSDGTEPGHAPPARPIAIVQPGSNHLLTGNVTTLQLTPGGFVHDTHCSVKVLLHRSQGGFDGPLVTYFATALLFGYVSLREMFVLGVVLVHIPSMTHFENVYPLIEDGALRLKLPLYEVSVVLVKLVVPLPSDVPMFMLVGVELIEIV